MFELYRLIQRADSGMRYLYFPRMENVEKTSVALYHNS